MSQIGTLPPSHAPELRKTALAGSGGGKGATAKRSLVVTLPLFAQKLHSAPLSPSAGSGSAPGIKVEDSSDLQAESSSRNPKRVAELIDDDDDFGLFSPSSSREPKPKRQRVRSSVPKPRAPAKAKVAVKVEEENRPEPRGQPEVWAEVPLITF